MSQPALWQRMALSRHSRESGNPVTWIESFAGARRKRHWIPAFAEIDELSKNVSERKRVRDTSFCKGIIWGVGAAATVHVGIQLYDLLTS